MTNTQLSVALVAFLLIMTGGDIYRFLKAKHKHYRNKKAIVETNFRRILSKICNCTTIDQLDTIEAEACKMLHEEADDRSLSNNAHLLSEHFNLRRYQLEGRIAEAVDSADKIDSLLTLKHSCSQS